MSSNNGKIATRTYKGYDKLSIIGMGGIVLMGHEQDEANRITATAIDAGVNYFDVAPSYGDGEAEEKLGPALSPYRDQVFLACKTGCRDAQGATAELDRSLSRLQTDCIDLYQFHGVTSVDQAHQLLATGGAAEAFLKARQDGKVRYLGFSAHSEEAALLLLDGFPADSILFPVNFSCYERGSFGPRVVEAANQSGVAVLALKAMASGVWPTDAPKPYPKCWYQPVDDPELAKLALRFTLSQPVVAALPPGDVRLMTMALEIAADFSPITTEEISHLRSASLNLTEPIFSS